MKYAYDKDKLLELLLRFKESLRKMPHKEATCILEKISVYLKEYIGRDALKELDMAFVSIGQKYGFVSAGDEFRKELADARAKAEEERQKAEAEKLETARKMVADGAISLENAVSYFGYSKEQILGK